MSDPLFGESTLSKGSRADRYTNPFYSIPLQYLPLNIDQMLWWAEHLLLRNGFYKTALQRIADYFITSLTIECDDADAREKYKNAMEELNWKEMLATAGLNLLAYGNEYITIGQGFNRYLVCKNCKTVMSIQKTNNYEFNKGNYSGTCNTCGTKGELDCKDMPSRALEHVYVKHWPSREIVMRADLTGRAEYYWNIPGTYKAKVLKKNNKFYSKFTPRVIFDCLLSDKMLGLPKGNFLHLKMPTPSSINTDGRALPPCIYMFDDFFMYQTLKKYNEVICFEDIAPFRVIAMDGGGGNPNANPLFHQNGGQWSASVDDMIKEHRRDPGAYHKFPFPLHYEQLGGQGKQLAPVEILEKYKADILGALNIPVEMFNMNFQAQQIAGPMLRMFENSWSPIINCYNKLLQHTADVVGKIQGLQKAKVKIVNVTFSDDIERKSIIGQLVSSNSIARSELLNLYSFDYEEQVRKKMQEDEVAQKLQQEQQEKNQLLQQNRSSVFNQPQQPQQGGGGGGGGQQPPSTGQGSSPQDILAQAQELAQELFPKSPAERRAQLQDIKATNQTLWAQTKAELETLTRKSASGGVQQAQQQAAQQQQGNPQ